ncbi:ATP-binding protein [Streptomyces sp. NPDC058655]|uniref:ATP-binding protein n=1 Tax=unclassified Streptomyces TaxID=2593676 RepID=UPI00365A36C2
MSVSTVFAGTEKIADARDLARAFLADLRTSHGLPVSGRAVDTVELVVSELVTNARKYAPGPYSLTLAVRDTSVEVSVWDSSPTPPSILAADPLRVGQHGLEIVMAAAHRFQVSQESAGKRITAAIPMTDGPGDA